MNSNHYVAIANEYALNVIQKRIDACKWVRLACERYLRDCENGKWRMDDEASFKACRVISLFPHVKGKWARQRLRLELEPWQVFILVNVFGWVHPETGLRRFRTVYIEVPRKNAKSTVSSGVGLYMLGPDEEIGAEVYSAATTRDQAAITYDSARQMVDKAPKFRDRFGIRALKYSIVREGTGSFFRALSADAQTLDGLNVHCAIVDELHAHKTRDVFDVLETATGAREQPLLWCITTAGADQMGVCYEQRTYVTKLLDSLHQDDTYFGCIWTIDEGDLWTDPRVWQKANPNWEVSVNPEDLERKALKAEKSPAAQNNFLTKHLNVWVNAADAWLNMLYWDRCAGSFEWDDMKKKRFPLYLGLDLSSKHDIASLILLWVDTDKRKYYLAGKHYLPEETIDNKEDKVGDAYRLWSKENHLIEIAGPTNDQDVILADILQINKDYRVQAIGYDPWQADQMALDMADKGLKTIKIPPGYRNYSEPMKELEALIENQRVTHDNNPCMNWMMSNIVAKMDGNDNIKPEKERYANKIDGGVAAIMAIAIAMLEPVSKPTISVCTVQSEPVNEYYDDDEWDDF